MCNRPTDCRAEQHRRIVADFGGRPWNDPGQPQPVVPIEADLKRLEVPVLAYNGEHDLADFLGVAEELQELLPNSRCQVIAEAGSFPAWEFPACVNAVVGAFLSEIGTGQTDN